MQGKFGHTFANSGNPDETVHDDDDDDDDDVVEVHATPEEPRIIIIFDSENENEHWLW